MSDLVEHIWVLRDKEGIPLHFRRRRVNNKVVWYIWYGYTLIAHQATEKTAAEIVSVAANVHRAAANVPRAATA